MASDSDQCGMGGEPVNPRRAATGAQRGYRYQTLLATLAWLRLEDGEQLIVEGDEDFDVLGSGTADPSLRTAYQAKHEDGRQGLGSPSVYESIGHFFTTFVERRHAGFSERFVFATTADRTLDARAPEARRILDAWEAGPENSGEVAQIIDFIQENTLAEHPLRRDPSMDAAAWESFVRAVRWNFRAPDYRATEQEIVRAIQSDERSGHLPPDLFAARLIDELWHASSSPHVRERVRTRADLQRLCEGATAATLEVWAGSSEAAPRLQALQDSRALEDLLRPGSHPPPQRPQSVGDLLGASYEVVPWDDTGRAPIFDDLLTWTMGSELPDPATRIRLLMGEGGTGKTRLAIELVAQLRHRGVMAGFFQATSDETSEAEPTPLFQALLRPGRPRLVVIDYAETKIALLKRFLGRTLELRGPGQPHLHILLVARNAGDWWQQLVREIPKLADVQAPHSLDEVVLAIADLKRQFWHAVSVFSTLLQRSPSALPAARFEDPIYRRPLFLHMAALALVESHAVHGRREILEATLDHETRFWNAARADRRIPVALDDVLRKLTPRAVAALTLIGGAAHEVEAETFLARATTSESPVPPQEVPILTLQELLRRTYDAEHRDSLDRRFLRGLEPDLLGEFQVLTLITQLKKEGRNPSAWLAALFPEPLPANLQTAFIVLGRIAADTDSTSSPVITDALTTLLSYATESRAFPCLLACLSVGTKTAHSPLGSLLAAALRVLRNPDQARDLARLMDPFVPENTVSLREVAAWVSHTLSQSSPVASNNVAQLAERARHKLNEALRLSELGHREEAEAAASEACLLHRRLNECRPDVFAQDLATSIDNLGLMLSNIGRNEEALEKAKEALEIRRRLAQLSHYGFAPDLAKSLNNMSNRLSDLRRFAEAWETAKEALSVCAQLERIRHSSFAQVLAMTRNNMGNRLSELGRHEEALTNAEEACALFRQLANDRPDAFEPDLALSLNNLGIRLSDLGRHEEALTQNEDVCALYRRLARNRPHAFEPYLAGSLHNMGNRQSDLGHREEARAAAEESAEIYFRLVERNRGAFEASAQIALRGYIDRCEESQKEPRWDFVANFNQALGLPKQ